MNSAVYEKYALLFEAITRGQQQSKVQEDSIPETAE